MHELGWSKDVWYLQKLRTEKKSQLLHPIYHCREMKREKENLLQNQVLKFSWSAFILQSDVVTLFYITQKTKIRHPFAKYIFQTSATDLAEAWFLYQCFDQNVADEDAWLKKRCMIFAKDQDRKEKSTLTPFYMKSKMWEEKDTLLQD